MKVTQTLHTFEQTPQSRRMIASQVAASTPLRKQKVEKDTALVKRIVATNAELPVAPH